MAIHQTWLLMSLEVSFLALPPWFQLPSLYKKKPKTQRTWPKEKSSLSSPRERQGYPWQREGWKTLSWLPPAERPFSGRQGGSPCAGSLLSPEQSWMLG